eukprot:TRINITY_DN870_c0_g1_i3.p1 TRINITY_DN870_c0_g1~~TRINITY_DN870_c0_g1_i3.p1  ORF type:complete len:396 (+),score=110.60 TRINITY_DN870_c0_g1_i3:174-1190(+)
MNLDGSYVILEDNKHFKNRKEFLQGRTKFELSLQPLEGTNEDTLPSSITCKLYAKDGTVITTNNFALKFYLFLSKRLFLASGETPRNILLIGPAGAGKSSFINSIVSMISHHITQEHAKSGGTSSGRVTRALKVFPLFDKNSKKMLNIRLWDAWGFEKDAFVGSELQLILKGEVPHDWDMEAAKKGDLGPIEKRADIPKRVQNAVIFFVPAGDIDTEDSQTVVRTKAMMTTASELELSCILVLSKFDSLVPNIEKDGRNCTAAQERINKASALFGIEPSRVFPLVNYTKQGVNNFNNDRMIYRILMAVSEISENHFLKQNYSLTAEQAAQREMMFPFG